MKHCGEYHIKRALHDGACSCVNTYWLPIRCILSISELPRMEKWRSWHLDASTRGKVNVLKSASCHSYAPGPTPTVFLRTAVYCAAAAGYRHTNTNTHLLLSVCSLNRVLWESVSVYCLYVPLSVRPDVYLCRTMDWPGNTWAQEVWSCVRAVFQLILIAFPWFLQNSRHDAQNTVCFKLFNCHCSISEAMWTILCPCFKCTFFSFHLDVNTVFYLLCSARKVFRTGGSGGWGRG